MRPGHGPRCTVGHLRGCGTTSPSRSAAACVPAWRVPAWRPDARILSVPRRESPLLRGPRLLLNQLRTIHGDSRPVILRGGAPTAQFCVGCTATAATPVVAP